MTETTRTETGTETAATRTGTETRTETETWSAPGTGTETTWTAPECETRSRSGSQSQSRSTETRTETETAPRRSWLAAGGYLSALTVAVMIVASLGQVVFAREKNFVDLVRIIGPDGYDITPWFAVFIFDTAVAALLHGGIRVVRRAAALRRAARLANKAPAAGGSPWPWWICAAIIGALSIFTNTQHTGAWITAPASVVVLTIWFLHFYSEFLELTSDLREGAKPKLVWSTLSLADFDLARRAWKIASTRPLALGVQHRATQGQIISERDLAILVAGLDREIYSDQLYLLLKEGPHGDKGRVKFWQRRRRARARAGARMTAGDFVDHYLGRPVIERKGIPAAEITYAVAPEMPPVAPPVVAAPPARPAVVAAPAAPALPPAPAAEDVPPVVPVSPAPPVPPRTTTIDVAAAVAAIKGLPTIDPSRPCGCFRNGKDKQCGWTLVEHIARKAEQVQAVLDARPDWATRTERISKTDVLKATGNPGSTVQNQVAWIFDQLRTIAQEQTTPV